ncbi:hypothetical protein [Paraferrimonas sedimenticola]|uniref:Uncharacterized protein n=1 Tax=Paraferrimonas sedimenticola TaxID=375674 RepID=A0AA37RS21_9GAMM|nr:hypothetical protein [Paraferrimonas sedimenticola]GLP95345.1 hypothetical protein GCM10007895_06510 [Paraferrimonas sedimenticola]
MSEQQTFIAWVSDNMSGSEWSYQDGTEFLHVNGQFIGGYITTMRSYFVAQNEHTARLMKLFKADKEQ